MGNTLEEGRRREVAPYVQDSAVFVYAVGTLADLTPQQSELLGSGDFIGHP